MFPKCRGPRISIGARWAKAPALPFEGDTMDLVYIGLTVLFFALSFGFVALCDRLGGER